MTNKNAAHSAIRGKHVGAPLRDRNTLAAASFASVNNSLSRPRPRKALPQIMEVAGG